MRNIGFILEYDGGAFSGWQTQPGKRTVHVEVRDALAVLLKEPPVVHCSGRTDAGVHAYYQVAHVHTASQIELWVLRRGLAALLPRDVALLAASEMPEDFHARRTAESKTYLYRVLNRRQRTALDRARVWHIFEALDLEAMAQAAGSLVGKHDFASFEGKLSEVKGTVRTIHKIGIRRHGDEIHIRVNGDGFLKYMVRNIAGTLVEIGQGKRKAADMAAMIAARDRTAAGQTAPPEGLYLERVYYPEPYETALRAGLSFKGEKPAVQTEAEW